MKRLLKIVFLAVALFTGRAAEAQWSTVYQDPNYDKHFTDLTFVTDEVGYAIGYTGISGFVLKTVDGGNTWTEIVLPSNIQFVHKLAMVNTQTGYILKGGVPGKIIKTTDGFASYTIANIDTSYQVMAAHFLDSTNGFYLNNSGRFRKITNSFNYSVVSDTMPSSNMAFYGQTGYLVGTSTLVKTTDGGQTWFTESTSAPAMSYDVTFSSHDTGYISVIDSTIHRTIDGGASFTLVRHSFYAQDIKARGNLCVAIGDTGDVIYSKDAGNTWTAEATGLYSTGPNVHHVAITPGGRIFAASYHGQIMRREYPSGTDEIEQGNDIAIYPNPSSGVITIMAKPDNVRMQLMDISGRLITEETMNNNSLQLDLSVLAPAKGIYIVKLVSGNNIIAVKKVVKL